MDENSCQQSICRGHDRAERGKTEAEGHVLIFTERIKILDKGLCTCY